MTHHLADILPETERVIMMCEGRIVADGAKDELIDAGRLGVLFGTDVHVTQKDGYWHWY